MKQIEETKLAVLYAGSRCPEAGMDKAKSHKDCRCEEYKGKSEAWDKICKLCPHNQDGIANCCISFQDDDCELMRDMKKALAERKEER